MKFLEVNPEEIDNIRQGRRGRVSYPLLKGFLETGMFIAEVDLTGIQQSKQSLSSSLTSYIRNHHLPIKMFQRNGKMYFMRLDVDKDGKQLPNWEAEQLKAHLEEADQPETPLTSEAVAAVFKKESGRVTK